MPVQVGGYSDDDACLAIGRIVEADLVVRSAPGAGAEIETVLRKPTFVWMCDSTDGGTWTGILYSKRGDERLACGVSGTIPHRRDYTGPCGQGWVPSAAIELYAG